MHRFMVSAFAAACFAASCGAASASPIGLWLAKDGARIRVSQCGGNLCGVIVQPAEGPGAVDKNNADPAKRGRPMAGVEILISMRRDGPNRWTGRVYNDDDGKIYEGHLIEHDQSSIRIEGCFLGICGGEDLTRIR